VSASSLRWPSCASSVVRLVTIVEITASPTAAPTWRETLRSAEATPLSERATPAAAALVIGTNSRENPRLSVSDGAMLFHSRSASDTGHRSPRPGRNAAAAQRFPRELFGRGAGSSVWSPGSGAGCPVRSSRIVPDQVSP
jgi:hypothetical protein